MRRCRCTTCSDTNGTELRAVAGNFLFSTGANEFAGRYTAGHFDLPMMGTTIALDGVEVIREGVLAERVRLAASTGGRASLKCRSISTSSVRRCSR